MKQRNTAAHLISANSQNYKSVFSTKQKARLHRNGKNISNISSKCDAVKKSLMTLDLGNMTTIIDTEGEDKRNKESLKTIEAVR